MGWFQVIMLVFKYGPTVYKIVKELIDLIGRLPEEQRAFAHAQLKMAGRDKAELCSLRDRLKGRCSTDPEGPAAA